jgi:alpha-tubulin suppressor-like RCC1 family protein
LLGGVIILAFAACGGGEPVGTSTHVKGIAAGAAHTCTSAGGVKCWGENRGGQLGEGTACDRGWWGAHPRADARRRVKCWGLNVYGQLGDGTTTDSSTPVAVSGLTRGVRAIAAGQATTCALTTRAEVKCWGIDVVKLGFEATPNRRLGPFERHSGDRRRELVRVRADDWRRGQV